MLLVFAPNLQQLVIVAAADICYQISNHVQFFKFYFLFLIFLFLMLHVSVAKMVLVNVEPSGCCTSVLEYSIFWFVDNVFEFHSLLSDEWLADNSAHFYIFICIIHFLASFLPQFTDLQIALLKYALSSAHPSTVFGECWLDCFSPRNDGDVGQLRLEIAIANIPIFAGCCLLIAHFFIYIYYGGLNGFCDWPISPSIT